MRRAVLALIAMCTACASSDAHPAVTVRDSAGIRIVESRSPAWGEGDGWRVSADALLTIGSQDGAEGVAFDRLSGVHLLDEERLVVLDNGAPQVRLFGPDGARLADFGRTGEGPGEFLSATLVGTRADSLWIFDVRQMRITVLDTRTARFREMRVELESPALWPVGLLPDGSSVVASNLVFGLKGGAAPPAGFQRFGAVYHRLDPLGEVSDSLFTTPGDEIMLRYGEESISILRPFVGRGVSHAVRGDEIVQGSQEAYTIGVYSSDGVLVRSLRRPGLDFALDDQAYEAAAEARVNALPEQARAGARNMYMNELRLEQRPAYSTFLIDADGHLWVQDFAYEGSARRWSVFDPEGAWLGMVELPAGFQPTHILRDRIAGIWRDGLDVEYARVYGLERQ